MQYPDEIMVGEDEVGLRDEEEDVLRSDGQASSSSDACLPRNVFCSF